MRVETGSMTGRTGERLGTNQVLAQVNNPQNQGPIRQIFKLILIRLQRLTEAIRQRNSSRRLMLSGDEWDRIANLLVANQAVCGEEKLCKVLPKSYL